jgi:hypothetical protein
VDSAAAGCDDISALSSATEQKALRMGIICLRPDDREIRVWDQETGASFRPADFRR